MAGSVRVLGLDPGFANVGFTLMRIDVGMSEGVRAERVVIEKAGLLWTEKSDKKRKVLAADDNTRRAREMTNHLTKLLLTPAKPGGPATISVKAICAEAMSFPRNSSSAAKMALTWGVIIALAETHGLTIVQASPQEIKTALCNNKSASKEDIRVAVERRFGTEVAGKMVDHTGSPLRAKADFEHPFDAIAAVVTGLNSEVLRLARSMAA